MSEELKPCPFCGGKARIIKESQPGFIQCKVACRNCGTATPFIGSKEQSIITWNCRAQQPNEPLTCDGCCENKPDEPWREICSECKRRPRQDLYARPPEAGEKE